MRCGNVDRKRCPRAASEELGEKITIDQAAPGVYTIKRADDGAPSESTVRTHFFGVFNVDPERYGRDLTRLQQEILPHLADADIGELRITVEI